MRFNSPDHITPDDDDLNEDEFLYVGDADDLLVDQGNDLLHEDDYESEISESEDPPYDDSKLVFDKHTKSVFCGSIHPEGHLAVTGSEDDKANVWNTETGELIFQCIDHSDSITITGFSFDGVYMATADMAGFTQVRKTPLHGFEGTWEVVWDYEAGDLSWGFWHHAAHILICSATAGEVYIWKIPSGETKILQGHGKQSLCGTLFRDGKRLAVGYDDGSIKVWDLKTAFALHHIPPDLVDFSPVNAIDSFHDSNLVIAGHGDGRITMMKAGVGKVVGMINVESEVEAIKFSKDPSLGLVAVGTLKGAITVWDVARQTIRHRLAGTEDEDATGVTTLLWINSYLLAACLNGSIKIFEVKSGTYVKTLTGHRAEILDMAYSGNTDLLLTTSEDNTCRIFKLDLPKL